MKKHKINPITGKEEWLFPLISDNIRRLKKPTIIRLIEQVFAPFSLIVSALFIVFLAYLLVYHNFHNPHLLGLALTLFGASYFIMICADD